MTRLTPLKPENTTGKTKELLEAVKSKMGRVPNLAGAMAHSPALLEGYLGLSSAIAGGKLDPKLRVFIALAVSERNGCAYCLSGNTTIGNKILGIDEATLLKSRTEESIDSRTDAALRFVRAIVDKKGRVSDAEVAAVKEAGYNDEDIAEISGNVTLNLLTNYFNELAGTEIDFPVKVSPLKETV
jgi:alkylhydroperoxidase family enzyme